MPVAQPHSFVDHHDVQRSPEPPVLKTIIQDRRGGAGLHRPPRQLRPIGPDPHLGRGKGAGQHERLVAAKVYRRPERSDDAQLLLRATPPAAAQHRHPLAGTQQALGQGTDDGRLSGTTDGEVSHREDGQPGHRLHFHPAAVVGQPPQRHRDAESQLGGRQWRKQQLPERPFRSRRVEESLDPLRHGTAPARA